MKFYNNYTKESFSILEKDTPLLKDNPLRFNKDLS